MTAPAPQPPAPGEAKPLDLDAIEARANAATPGPWHVTEGPPCNVPDAPHGFGTEADGTRYTLCGMRTASPAATVWRANRRVDPPPRARETTVHEEIASWCLTVADAQFIRGAREDVPALTAEVRQLRADLNVALAAHGCVDCARESHCLEHSDAMKAIAARTP